MSLREDLESFVTGAPAPDFDSLLADEHERYRLYLDVLAESAPVTERTLIAAVLRDPDEVMAEAAIVRHVDLRATQLTTGTAFAQWATAVTGLLPVDSFPVRRITEWHLFKAIQDTEPWHPEALATASDWLQRKVAEQAASPVALAGLAEYGRTRRIRNAARTRLHP